MIGWRQNVLKRREKFNPFAQIEEYLMHVMQLHLIQAA
jgi:hypothetical protein